MRRFVRINAPLLAVAWALLLATGAPAQEKGSRPNFVVMIADDVSPDDLGPYGQPHVRTPHLNALAKQGLRFDRAFLTCSSCSPSRSSILTGRYPHSTGAAELHQPLPADQVTVARLLKEAGYYTATAGKWHLGEHAKRDFDKLAGGSPSGCENWVATLAERPRDKPFFLWLAAVDAHRPYEEGAVSPPHKPTDVSVPPFLPDTPETRADLALYYDEISRLDENVGLVLAELEKQEVAENTLVLFLADNGRPFPRCKTTLYDSGVKTPLIARWPARIARSQTSASLVSSIDLAPTLLELSGVKPPPPFQGKSLAKLLADPSQSIREQAFSEHNWHDYQAHERCVRTQKYLYIRNAFPDLTGSPPADAVRSPTFAAMLRLEADNRLPAVQRGCFVKPRAAEELYDVEIDPHALKNLAADPALAKPLDELRKALDAWIKETGDAVPKTPTPDRFDRISGKPLK